MAEKIRTVSGLVLFVLSEQVDGLEFNELLRKCNFVGIKEAFETTLRSLKRHNKIFAWKGKFHHSKYLDEKARAKKVASDELAKISSNALRKIKREVNKDLELKISTLDKLIDFTGGDINVVLKKIKNNLLLVSDARL